jgi:hypothetical protein
VAGQRTSNKEQIMKLTRYNYEEYFILYLDNELNSEERREVDAFVQLHPDLKEELDLLLLYKLTPDTTIIYEGKNELIKTTDNPLINLNNYEEWFLLYTDNELSAPDQLIVEQFLIQHPSLKKELSLLQMTKLQGEEMVFTDKASLYKTAEKAPVIPIHWWKTAVAAVLVVGIGFTTYSVLTNKSTTGREIIAAAQNNKPETKPLPVEENQVPLPNALTAENNRENKGVVPAGETTADKKSPLSSAVERVQKTNQRNENIVKLKPVESEKNDAVFAENKQPSNNLPTPENNPNLKIPLQNDALAINDIQEGNVNPITSVRNNVTNKLPLPSNIRQASFKDDAIFDQDDKKNKLRGFFRKITRTLEKRTDIDATDDNGRLLVAGLAINLK